MVRLLRALLDWLSPPTRRSALVRAAHLGAMPPVGHPEHQTALAILCRTAESFLRSGGTLSLEDFGALSPDERAAFEVASSRVTADRSAALGLATQGVLGAACVLAEVDGGDARLRVLLEQAAENASPGGRR